MPRDSSRATGSCTRETGCLGGCRATCGATPATAVPGVAHARPGCHGGCRTTGVATNCRATHARGAPTGTADESAERRPATERACGMMARARCREQLKHQQHGTWRERARRTAPERAGSRTAARYRAAQASAARHVEGAHAQDDDEARVRHDGARARRRRKVGQIVWRRLRQHGGAVRGTTAARCTAAQASTTFQTAGGEGARAGRRRSARAA